MTNNEWSHHEKILSFVWQFQPRIPIQPEIGGVALVLQYHTLSRFKQRQFPCDWVNRPEE
jgi:hypothetical protein